MPVSLLSVDGDRITVSVEVTLGGGMLACEERIQAAVNDAGRVITEQALKRFDTDGRTMVLGGENWTSKGQEPKAYQTPYGEVSVGRHVYQSSAGGKTYCPLDRSARIVVTSTPKFAQQVGWKFAQGSSVMVQRDLAENHGRAVSRSYVQGVAEAVSAVAQAKEEDWHYATPTLAAAVASVAIGLDGTGLLLCEDGYRQAMVGTVSLYDHQGERLHTLYVGASPEYGKATFLARLEREIQHIQALYPAARYVGVADGAAENWRFLAPYVSEQIIDFYHATGYIAAAAQAAFPRHQARRQAWLAQRCHALKHTPGAAGQLLEEMEALADKPLSKAIGEKLAAAITYFRNHQHQMNYADYQAQGWPLGSGVTEAACKTLVKQRLCQSGMKWKDQGARIVLSLRALVLTEGRWGQFWAKISQYGLPLFA